MIIGAIGTSEIENIQQRIWLENTIMSWMARWDIELTYTNLESGSLVLIAEAWMKAAVPFRLILPPKEGCYQGLDNARLQKLLRNAAATHHLEAGDSVETSRQMVLENSEILFVVSSGDTAKDDEMKLIEAQACEAQVAVIALCITNFSVSVICKSEQW